MKNILIITKLIHCIFFLLLTIDLSAQYGIMPTSPTPNRNHGSVNALPYRSIESQGPQAPNPDIFTSPEQCLLQQRQKQLQQQQENMEKDELFREYLEKQEAIKYLTDKGFRSYSDVDPKGTGYFHQAFDEIHAMLKGEKPLNLGRIVFIIENAFYENAMNYTDYQNFIKDKVALCNRKIAEEKLNGKDNLVKNMMLFRLISDTLRFKNYASELTQTHFPIRYDYDDYQSKQSYDSHFVTQLMRRGVGQCYSMPLYYLVLAEAIGAEAYWSFSPRHSFIKIQDEKGRWYNIELTCNAILSDAHYMNSGYIKAEAIRNRLYLEPLDKTNTAAELLLILARYYHKKFGLDDFYLKCADTAMQYLSCKLNALILQAGYSERLTLQLAQLLKAPKPDILKTKSPQAYRHYEKMHDLYKQIDDLGYEPLPDEIYVKWLEYIAKQKEQTEKTNFLQIVK